MERKQRKTKTALLYAAAVILSITSIAVVCADVFLAGLYARQRQSIQLASGATPIPVISSSPTAAPSAYVRTHLFGDMNNPNFPEYDTGSDADYSYQSDELRIAVHKVQDMGVTYFAADIWMRNISCFRTAFANGKYHGKRESPEKISTDSNAILAVNGDFLGGLAIRNGIEYSKATERLATPTPNPKASPTPTPTPTPSPEPWAPPTIAPEPRPERATCVLYRDGRIVTEEFDTFRTTAAMKAGAWQGWQFGPTLVRNGKPASDVKKQGRNPRCMLGYYEPGHYCLVVIDGRQKDYSIGMNYDEMIDLAVSMGFQEAYNLDGGGSAVMTFNGKIINSPSGKGDARKLTDMIVIGEYLSPGDVSVLRPTPDPTPMSGNE